MTPPSQTSPSDTTRKIDLNLTQVAAGALAAVTAAALGSRLGIAGTMVGAAAASMTLTVGTVLYRASLERSQEKLRSLTRRTTQIRAPQPADRAAWWRSFNLRWWTAVVGTIGAFVLAMLVITGFEWARGETLGGHGEGTSIGREVNPPSSPEPAVPPVPVTPSPEVTPPGTAPTPTPEVAPDDETDSERDPSEDTDTPTPTEEDPTTPLIPPVLPVPRG